MKKMLFLVVIFTLISWNVSSQTTIELASPGPFVMEYDIGDCYVVIPVKIKNPLPAGKLEDYIFPQFSDPEHGTTFWLDINRVGNDVYHMIWTVGLDHSAFNKTIDVYIENNANVTNRIRNVKISVPIPPDDGYGYGYWY